MALITSCLAIRPGRRCGWARYNEHGTLKMSGVIDGSNATSPAQIVERAQPTMIVVQDWSIPRKARQSTKELAYQANLWQALGEALGFPTLMVTPSAWKAWANDHLDGPPIPAAAKSTGPGVDQAIRAKALIVADAAGLDENYQAQIQADEADAILMGAWAISYTQTQINRARIAQGVKG